MNKKSRHPNSRSQSNPFQHTSLNLLKCLQGRRRANYLKKLHLFFIQVSPFEWENVKYQVSFFAGPSDTLSDSVFFTSEYDAL